MSDGIVVERAYLVDAPGGGKANIEFSVGAPYGEHSAAVFARAIGALAYGLISVAGWPNGPQFPLIWTYNENHLDMCIAEEDAEGCMTPELQSAIRHYIAVFFAEISKELPQFAGLRLSPPDVAGDKTVH